jgi:hypothetical protein
MREERELEEDVWYDTNTKMNNGEQLFGVKDNFKQFEQVVSAFNRNVTSGGIGHRRVCLLFG